MFTTEAIDNADHNASSSTSKNHFHGISISLFQHLDSPAAYHQIVFDLSSKALGGQRDFKLLSYYTEITPVGAVKSHCPIKTINSGVTKPQAHPVQMCNKWLKFLDHVNCSSHKETVTRASNLAAYHQESSEQMPSVPTTSVLLPLINESINSPTMVKHCMVVVQRTIQDINHSQVPVITADQPVYALLKQIQWKYPNTFGKDSFVIMMGGLHLEMAMLAVLGFRFDAALDLKSSLGFNQIHVQEFDILISIMIFPEFFSILSLLCK